MKILVTIISTQKYFESRIKLILDTWMKDFENYLIISDYDDSEFNTVKVTDDISYEGHVEKNLKSFVHIYENFGDFDWFINVDDDTFVNFQNLQDFIITLPQEEPIKVGYINVGSVTHIPSLNYHSGGAGTLYNRKALEILKNCWSSGLYGYSEEIHPKKSKFGDANVGIFCNDNNLEQIHCPLFHPREPSYWNYSPEEIKKQITFHYIFNEEFYNLYNLIHQK